jgi:hypothetical protein
VIVSLIEKPNEPVNLVSGFLAEPADRAENVLWRSVGLNVQPIQAG